MSSISSLMAKSKQLASPEQIQWLSYHIPKTAGSSLRYMLYKEFGRSRVFGVYEPEDAKKLGSGQYIDIPRNTTVVHGHFKPHPQHRIDFANTQTMVWVRDPIERLWSLVGHLMDLQHKHPHYEKLHSLYVSRGIDRQADIVERIIKEASIPYMVNAYCRFFSACNIDEISFVGSVHNFATSVDKMNSKFNLSLQPVRKNTRTTSAIPQSISSLKSYMEHEYNLVDRYL